MKEWLWEDSRYPDFPYKADELIEEIMVTSAIDCELLKAVTSTVFNANTTFYRKSIPIR